MKSILPSTIVLAAMSSAAAAHPGSHDLSVVSSLVHLLTEPDHLAMLSGAIVAAFVAWRWMTRSKA